MCYLWNRQTYHHEWIEYHLLLRAIVEVVVGLYFFSFFPYKWRLREFFPKTKLATFSSMIIIGGWLLEIWVKQDKLVTSTQRLLSWKWNRAKSKSLRLLSHRVHHTVRVHIIYVTSWIISFLSFFSHEERNKKENQMVF